MKNVKRGFLLSVAVFFISAFGFSMVCTGCGTEKKATGANIVKTEGKSTPATIDFFAMDTYMTLTAYGDTAESAVNEAKKKIEALDKKLSTGNTDSEIATLNKTGKVKATKDVYELFQRSITLSKETDGNFQPLMQPVMELWGFPSGKYQVPKKKQLEKALTNMNIQEIKCQDDTHTIQFEKEGMKADLGGIAKGYTSDAVMALFREKGVEHAVISLGGNTQTLGDKPDGSAWRVAIEDPQNTEKFLGIVEVKNKAVITSGGYERYFEKNGKKYHHIIDPATGYPAENGLQSVSIISEDGTLADGLSTALFVMGLEKAEQYWKAHSDAFDMVLETDKGTVYVTDGIEKNFSSEKEMQVIRKGE